MDNKKLDDIDFTICVMVFTLGASIFGIIFGAVVCKIFGI